MIRAAGGVLWRHGPHGREVAVVHRPRYDDWSLPKGKLEDGEPHLLASVREIEEETGLRGAVGPWLGTTSYDVDGRKKTVRWWSVRADDGAFRPNTEVDELRWLDADQALAVVVDGEPVRRWAAVPAEAGVLLLVRHGSAGDPHAWQGDDDDRPLDRRGREQAEHIARVVAAHRPVRILSAPPLRCRQTIEPLAAAVGLAVDVDPEVGEAGAPQQPEVHALSLVVPGETVVVCSQGGVIPRIVDALVPGEAPSDVHKGGMWALTVAAGSALTADPDALI